MRKPSPIPAAVAVALITGWSGLAGATLDYGGADGLVAEKHDRADHRGHYGPRGRPWRHPFKELNLTEEQKTQIRQIFEANRGSFEAERDRLRELRRGFATAEPGSAAYTDAAAQLAEAQAARARSRVQQHAAVRTQIYGLLDAQQKARFLELAANKSKPREPQPAQE